MSENYKYRVVIYEKRGSDKTGATVVDVKCDDFDLKYKRKDGKMGRITMEWEENDSKEEKNKIVNDTMVEEWKEKEEKKKDKKKDGIAGNNGGSEEKDREKKKKKKRDDKEEKEKKENEGDDMVDDETMDRKQEKYMKKEKKEYEGSENKDIEKKKEKTPKRKNGGKEEKVDDKNDDRKKKKDRKSKLEPSKEIINFKIMGETLKDDLLQTTRYGKWSKRLLIQTYYEDIVSLFPPEFLSDSCVEMSMMKKQNVLDIKDEHFEFSQLDVFTKLMLETVLKWGRSVVPSDKPSCVTGKAVLFALTDFKDHSIIPDSVEYAKLKRECKVVNKVRNPEIPCDELLEMAVTLFDLRGIKKQNE